MWPKTNTSSASWAPNLKPTKGVDCKQKVIEFHQTLEFHPTPITYEQIMI
jgi:hypothetical protein